MLSGKEFGNLKTSVKILCYTIIVTLLFFGKETPAVTALGEVLPEITAEACILMEGTTGKILFEKNKNKVLPPASITKIMTLLLAYEALEQQRISSEDMISVSEHAAGMGGSQVFLEAGECQTVETMIKCICISSANDACVALAEHIAGTEEAFVALMNKKAAELGMRDTHFINCCGLDADGHVSSAYDIALMSRELMMHFSQVRQYTTRWMDTMIHSTKKGNSEFGLTNTNKLIKQYPGITGLKTGSTANAKYCLSATAERNDLTMIAVVMAAPDTKTRFKEATVLLNYGFANTTKYIDRHEDFPDICLPVRGGKKDCVPIAPEDIFQYILWNHSGETVEEKLSYYEHVNAPIEQGEELGLISYYLNGKEIGHIALIAGEKIEKATYWDYLRKAWKLLT